MQFSATQIQVQSSFSAQRQCFLLEISLNEGKSLWKLYQIDTIIHDYCYLLEFVQELQTDLHEVLLTGCESA